MKKNETDKQITVLSIQQFAGAFKKRTLTKKVRNMEKVDRANVVGKEIL